MTPKLRTFCRDHRPALLAGAAALACLLAAGLVWLALVRPQTGKSLSQKISDDYPLMSEPIADGQSATQTFSFDEDLLAVALVFGIEGDQPQGTLEVTLSDAATGEVLATSWGDMSLILPGQYTGLGLDAPVAGVAGRQYRLTLTPRYTGGGRLCLGVSDGAALWQEECTINGQAADATLALIVTYRTIGGFLNRYFLGVAALAALVLFLGVRAALRRRTPLHRLVFALVVGFGLLYGAVLPPYAVPDEKYHINQSFTLACRWANWFSADDWRMGNVPIDMSYRREHDQNALIQNENTTVFTWQEVADNVFTLSPDAFDSHAELAEYQTDRNPLLYLVSAAAVFLGFVLRLGFVPVLLLGRLANLLAFAALASLAVRHAPFGRRIFAAAALLPMTLHLACSFSRDALLLGLAFAFTSLCLQAVFGNENRPLTPAAALATAACGVLLAPAKAVYLPLCALFLLVPAVRLGRRARLKKAAYLAVCLALMLWVNRAVLATALTNPDTLPAAETAAETEAETDAEALSLRADAVRAAPGEEAKPAAGEEADEVPAADNDASPLAAYLDAIPAEYLDHTPEAFVRRVYYCAGLTQDVADSEVEFWAQALVEGDVSAAELGQSFFFSPEEMEKSSFTDEDFIRAVTLVYFGGTAVNDWSWQVLTEQGRVLLFKACYTVEPGVAELEACGVTIGMEDADHYPLDRAYLAEKVEAARAVRATQSVAAPEDQITYTPGYLVTHLPDALLLLTRTVVQDADDVVRGLVGGLLGYDSVELAWVWVLAAYGLLAFAVPSALDEPGLERLPQGRDRAWLALAALGCCALTVAGCLVWTPTYYETLYGLQGRYWLPVLPLALTALIPRHPRPRDAQVLDGRLVCGACALHFGVLLNIMLVIIAR